MRIGKLKRIVREVAPVVEGIMGAIPDALLSDEMIRRDNFFHNCWILFKKNRPDLCLEMQNIELTIAGYDPNETNTESDEKSDKKPNKNEGVIM